MDCSLEIVSTLLPLGGSVEPLGEGKELYVAAGRMSRSEREIVHKIIHKTDRFGDYGSKLHEVAVSARTSGSTRIYCCLRTFCYLLHRLEHSLGSWRSTAELLPLNLVRLPLRPMQDNVSGI